LSHLLWALRRPVALLSTVEAPSASLHRGCLVVLVSYRGRKARCLIARPLVLISSWLALLTVLMLLPLWILPLNVLLVLTLVLLLISLWVAMLELLG
jgi:hypothetical protein